MAQIRYADLEIGLSALNGTRYQVDIQYYPPADAGDDARQPRVTGEAKLDPQEFLGRSSEEYGRLLSDRLFEDPKVREQYVLARAGTYGRAADPCGLRVRLWFGPNAERLYDLRWETLCEPGGDLPLSTHDLIPLSRFSASDRNRPVRVRPKEDLRALVVIASPEFEEDTDDGKRALAVVNVQEEWSRVHKTLGGLAQCRLLAQHADAVGRPTPEALQNELNSTSYDILYIVCHGVLLAMEDTYLVLEDDAGKRKDLRGSILRQALEAGTMAPPRLVVLTACQSAGTGSSTENRAHHALGLGLTRAGVAAVLAMNGKVTTVTAAEFYTRFFAELQGHGCVDRAMTTARRALQAIPRSDWWMPTLYMRLSAGCIWSVPHLIQRDQEPYDELSLGLQGDSCVPIVGPALLEPLWGSARDVARELAEKLGFPLAPFRREDLPSVAQYVARRRTGRNSRMDALNIWLAAAEAALKRKSPGLVAKVPDLDVQKPAQRLTSLLRAVTAERFKPQNDPYALLARLPASIYITATPDPLLADALHAAKRPPVVEYTRWTYKLEGKLFPRRYDENDKNAMPTRDKPLVFHLFGTLEEPESIVLTEDDYFDYLIHIAKDANNTAIPMIVRNAYSQNALMVLGFDLDEWCFRALYRTIRSELGHGDQGALSAVVQLNPEEDRHLRPMEALQYLEKMFGTENMNLSWAQPAEFLRQVWQRLPTAFGGPP